MKTLFTAAVTAMLFCACGNLGGDEENPQLDSLKAKYTNLQKQAGEKDESINEMLRSFNEIEENLAKIKEQEGIISSRSNQEAGLDERSKNKIVEDIQLINALMLENKRKISWLRQQLKKSGVKIDELNKLIEQLNKSVEEKDMEITELKEQLTNLQISMEELTAENEAQNERIGEQTEKLNTAFYAFGTSKELIGQGVITKEGGFIGLGRIEKLREDFAKDYFTRIDITQTKSFDIFAKKARIVTSHPKGSYKLEGDGKVDRLIVTDPTSFWSVSKYLVVVVN
ncbi:MAG: hypothetical protein ACE5DN_06990 [Flavobacteriales bacterium]